MQSPAEPKKKTSPWVVALLTLAGVTTACCGLGIVSMIAIPYAINHIKREKTEEAHTQLAALATAVRSACGATHAPITALPTPQEAPGRVKQMGRFREDPGFAALQFDPGEPLYYQYSITTEADGTYVLLAEGNLDGDENRSRFELRCTSACRCGEVTFEDELE